uniref:Glycosyltransferase family 92 protein n=1 Tax=Caenorhabditis japonica TaxID=281687 RepID=A0A8R1DZ96_CAEJA
MVIYALLVAFEIPDLVQSIDGWPDYASAIIFEFYSDSSNLETYFKVLYRDNADSELSDVTANIPMCNGELFCSMQAFQNLSEYYRPLPDFNTVRFSDI